MSRTEYETLEEEVDPSHDNHLWHHHHHLLFHAIHHGVHGARVGEGIQRILGSCAGSVGGRRAVFKEKPGSKALLKVRGDGTVVRRWDGGASGRLAEGLRPEHGTSE